MTFIAEFSSSEYMRIYKNNAIIVIGISREIGDESQYPSKLAK